MLCAWRVDDQIGGRDLRRESRIDRDRRFPFAKQRLRGRTSTADDLALVRRQRTVDQVNLADAVRPGRVDDRGLRREQLAVGVDRDEERVGAVGDVLEETGRQTDDSAVVVHGLVEIPVRQEKGPCEHEVPQTAVGEIEGAPGRPDVVAEPQEARAEMRAMRVLKRRHDPRNGMLERIQR